MPKIGDTVLYGTSGACVVDCVNHTEYGEYYVLIPLFMQRTKISVPKNNPELVSRMRPVPAPNETKSLIKHALKITPRWIEDENKRKENAKQIIAGDDDAALMQLIRCFHLQKQKTLQAGKKFHVSDENILKNAQVKLHNEYAVVFDVAPDEVPALIASLDM